MHKNTPKIISRIAGGLLFAASSKLLAAEISKLNNSDNLNLASSWVGGAVPGLSDIAVFDEETIGATPTFSLGAALSFKGLKVTDSNLSTVSNGQVQFSGFTLTTGFGGIDLSQASQGIDSSAIAGLAADTSQKWTVPAGRILYFQSGSTLARGARSTLNLDTESGPIAATYSQDGNQVVITKAGHGLSVGSTVRLNFGGASADTTLYVSAVPDASTFTVLKADALTETGALTYWSSGAVRSENFTTSGARLGVYATYNKFDWVYNAFLDNTWFQFTDSVGAGVTYTTNPSDGGVDAAQTVDASVNTTFLNNPVDIVNSNITATATALRLLNWHGNTGGNTANSGFRFNVPHATTGTPWVVDMTANGGQSATSARIYLNSAPFSVLVTPNVGAHNVEINGGANSIGIRYNNAASEFIAHQHNTQGDLILNVSFSNSNGGSNANFVKTGAGKVIMDNVGFVGTGTVSVQEGRLEVGRNNVRGTLNNRPIVNNGTVAFKRTDAVTYTGIISGAGTVESAMTTATGELVLSAVNTYTGPTLLTSGRLSLANASSLGVGGPITLAGGTLRYATGITTDISSRSVTISGASTLDTNGNNVTYASSIGNSGGGSLIKAATNGVLTLAGANTYTGGTTINGGSLAVTNTSGSATGAGSVTIASGATLTGTGTIAGPTTMTSGSTLDVAGSAVGTLTIGGLNLAAGSLLTLDANASVNDKVVVTQPNGVSLSGGAITLRGNWLNTPGTYTIIQGSGAVGGTGVGALSVVNPASGYGYSFANTAGSISLTTILSGLISEWTSTSGGAWGTSSNWGSAVPSAQGDTAKFSAQLVAPSTVTLPGNLTVGGVSFNSSNGYTLSGQPGETLTFNNGAQPSALNAASGNHTITVPVVLASELSSDIAASSSITLSGAVSGSHGITKSGAGTLFLTGANNFTGLVQVTDGFVSFSQASGLGTGNLTLNGGGISYGAGNTIDLSTKVFTIGLSGGILDTNGNNVTFAAPIGNGGTGAFTKSGAGTLTLAAGNTFSGGTSVVGGTLVLTGANTLGGLNTIGSATLQIDGDAALGDASSGITFAPGASNTATLRVAGAATLGATRALTLSSGTAVIDTVANTVVISGALTGPGVFSKAGSGSLTLNGVSEHTGGVIVNDGTLVVGSAGVASLGTGTVTLNGTSTLNLGVRNLGNALIVNGTNALLSGDGGGVSAINAITGPGTLNVAITGANVDLRGALTGFNGTLAITSATGNFRFNGTAGGDSFSLNLGTGSTSVRNGATALAIGSLEGAVGSILGGSGGGATQAVTYTVGANNRSTTFAGAINNGAGVTSLTKVGTGTLTLSGASLGTGNTTVNGGTLIVDGSLLASTLSVAAPATPFMVNTGATLGGTGSIGSAATIAAGATVRPDATGLKRGALTFTGGLTLQGATQFDVKGTGFTAVNSTLDGGLVYGGSLKVNFLSTLYNGTYQLFQFVGATTGSFTNGVTVATTTVPGGVALVDGGSGTLTGTIDGATVSFNSATGALIVSGATTAVQPSVPGGVTATAGNAKVTLQWNASTGTPVPGYRVKRSTTAGGPYTVVSSSVVTTNYVDTGLTNDTTYYYVLDAISETGTSAESLEVSATPIAVVLSALDQWRAAQLGSLPLADQADAADPDKDGIPNLMEYATGRIPTVADTTPVLTIVKASDTTHWAGSFNRIADPKLTYDLQAVNDLAGTPTWTTVATSTTTDNVAGAATLNDTQLISASARRFLRLQVSYTTTP